MRYVSESFEVAPLVSSATLPWQGVRVEQYHLAAGELPAHYHAHHLLMLYQVEAPFVLHQPQDRRALGAEYCTGDLGLYPGGEYGTIRWTSASDNIYVMVDDEHLERVARQGLDLPYHWLVLAARRRLGRRLRLPTNASCARQGNLGPGRQRAAARPGRGPRRRASGRLPGPGGVGSGLDGR